MTVTKRDKKINVTKNVLKYVKNNECRLPQIKLGKNLIIKKIIKTEITLW